MKTLKIKDICDKGSSALKQKDVEGQEGKYPVYGASGYISSIDTYHQDKDYIAIVKDGSGIGRVTFMPAYSSVIGTMQYILPKEGYNIKYISYCLQSLDLAKYKQGAAIPHIYFRDYGERYVNIEESLPEQERIVSLLDAEFAKIDAIKANAEKQLQDAKALFQSALKDLLTPKEGWKEKRFGMIYDVRDGTHDSPKYQEEGFPLVTSKNLKGGKIDFSNIKYISEIDYQKINERSKVDIGDVLFAMIGTIGNPVLVTEEPFYAIKNMALFKVPCNQSGKYLQYLLSSNKILDKFHNDAKGTTQKFVGLGYLRNFSFPMPEYTEQLEIIEKIKTFEIKITKLQVNYEQTVTLCNDLKQSILKDIFG